MNELMVSGWLYYRTTKETAAEALGEFRAACERAGINADNISEDDARLEPVEGETGQIISAPKWTEEQLEEAYRIREHQYRIEDVKQMLGWLYEREIFGVEAELAPEMPDILEAVVKEYEKRMDCNEDENTTMQNACEAVMKSIWEKFPESIKPGTYNIGFTNSDGRDDETQFDPGDIGELKALWMEFCKDNNFDPRSVTYVEEGKED